MSSSLRMRSSQLACLLTLASCTANESRLDGPTQALLGPDGSVYVGDGYFNGRIAVFSQQGEFERSWGRRGFGRGQFHNPHGLAFLADGTLLVADRDNARLQLFRTDGELLDIWRDEELGRPWSVAASPTGEVFVVDGGDQEPEAARSGIVALTTKGEVQCRLGKFGTGVGELNEGHMLAVADSGDLYVAEIGNQRVQRFERTLATPCGFEADPSWPHANVAKSMKPLGVAAAGDRVYVSDERAGQPIRVLDAQSGELIDVMAEGQFTRAHGLSVDAQGTLWVVDVADHRVSRLDESGDIMVQLP